MIGIYSARYRCEIMATDKIKVAVRVRPFNRRGMYSPKVSFLPKVSTVIVSAYTDGHAFWKSVLSCVCDFEIDTIDSFALRSEYVLTVTFFQMNRGTEGVGVFTCRAISCSVIVLRSLIWVFYRCFVLDKKEAWRR